MPSHEIRLVSQASPLSLSDTGHSAIYIVNGDSTRIRNNTISGANGEGIANGAGATNTNVINNTSENNRTDLCNDGTVGTVSGNTFATGGIATACVVM